MEGRYRCRCLSLKEVCQGPKIHQAPSHTPCLFPFPTQHPLYQFKEGIILGLLLSTCSTLEMLGMCQTEAAWTTTKPFSARWFLKWTASALSQDALPSTWVCSFRRPPPHTAEVSVILDLPLYYSHIFLYPTQNKNLLANITEKKSKGRLIFRCSTRNSENAVRSGTASPHLLTLLSSVLAPFSGTLSLSEVETAAHSTRLSPVFSATPAKEGFSHFNISNESPRMASGCCDWVMYLTVDNHQAQGGWNVLVARSRSQATSGVMGRVAPPKPQRLRVGMERFPKEQNTVTRIRWDRC